MMYVVIVMASFTLGFVLVVVAGQWIADRQAWREDEARATDWLTTAAPAASGTSIDEAARWMLADTPDPYQEPDPLLTPARVYRPLWPDDELRRAEAERSNL